MDGGASGSRIVREQVALVAVTGVFELAALGGAMALQRWTGSAAWFVGPALLAPLVVVMVARVIGYRWLGWGTVDAEGVRVGLAGPPERLDERVYRECEAMAEHALSSGLAVPTDALRTLGDLAVKYPKRPPPGRGAPVPDAPDPTAPNGDDYARLGAAHELLAAVVAPATPRSLRIINDGQYNRVLTFLGRVRLVRCMIYVAAALLVAFVAFAMNSDFTEGQGVFGASGSTELFNALELVAAAGLGAVFYGLYKANRFITTGSYDPKYEASYWIRFTLGIVGGILLAVVLDVGGDLSKPLLALLGGFAAEAVYKILIRFVEMLETLVDGSAAHRPADDAPPSGSAVPRRPQGTGYADGPPPNGAVPSAPKAA